MTKLSKEERAELERRLAEDDQADEDFEVEIRDGDKATRLPYSRGRSWLQEHFGIDLPPMVEGEDEDEGEPAKGGKAKSPAGGGEVRRFGRRVG